MIAVGGLTRFSDPISWAVVPFALCLDGEAVREAEDFAVTHNARGVATTLVAYEQGTVRQQVIEAKQAIGNQWLVSAGFSAGDRVVVQGTQRAMTCSPRGCYGPAASRAACLSMRQTKATRWRSARVLA